MFDIPGMTARQERAIFTAGITLHATQAAERVLGLCLAFIAPDDKELTVEVLLSATAANHDRTLGFLIRELTKRATIQPGFETTLRKFTNDRNRFVHRLFAEEEFALDTDDGAQCAIDFMNALAQTAADLQDTLNAHVAVWASQSQIPGNAEFAQDALHRDAGLQRRVRDFEALIHPQNPST